MQLHCPSCGTTDLKGSQIVEANVVVINTITSNPRAGVMKVRRGEHRYDGSPVALICRKCGAENLLDSVEYDLAK